MDSDGDVDAQGVEDRYGGSNEESFDESVGNTEETRVSALQQNTVDPLDDKDETDE